MSAGLYTNAKARGDASNLAHVLHGLYRSRRAKARIDADIALERSIAAARRESDELEQARTELRLKREARERAELLYSSDIAATARRLRDREALLDRARGDLSSSYERQRLYDSIRRLRTARTSLTDQLIDFDTRSRRLASLYRCVRPCCAVSGSITPRSHVRHHVRHHFACHHFACRVGPTLRLAKPHAL